MKTENLKRQSYLRLLKLVKPYRKMLIIGIIAGVMTGGFFGASFFWLKGFVTPFEKTQAQLTSQSAMIKSKASVNKDAVQLQKKEKGTMGKMGAGQLDSIVTYADYLGIPLKK